MTTVLISNTLINSGITIAILLFLFILFLVTRRFTDKHRETIKTRQILLSYFVLFFAILGATIGIMAVWGYDLSEYFGIVLIDASDYIAASIHRLITTLLVILVTMGLYKVTKIGMWRFAKRATTSKRRKQTLAKIIASISKYALGLISIVVILGVWGVNVAPVVAGLGIAGLVIGLGAQKFINDLISGFFIIFEHHYDVGDWVEIGGFMGEVIDIGLKTTKVKNFKGEIKIFNNGSIDPVSNFSQTESLAIAEFGIAYKEDIAQTIAVLREHLPDMRKDHPEMLEDPRVLGVTELGSSSVNLRVVCKVVTMTQWGIERAIRQRIKEILVEQNIEIPFPQVVIHQPTPKKTNS